MSATRRVSHPAPHVSVQPQLLRYAALKLGVEIGSEVQKVIPKAHRDDVQQRNRAFVESVCDHGTLSGTLRVPDAIADMTVTADLRARLVTTSGDLPRCAARLVSTRLSATTSTPTSSVSARPSPHCAHGDSRRRQTGASGGAGAFEAGPQLQQHGAVGL